MICIQKTLKTPPKLLELINEISKVAVHKINTPKSVASLHIENELSEKEIEKTISFIIAPKRRKYLGINLSKEKKDHYTKNCMTPMKDIKEDTKHGKLFHVHGVRELMLKCPYYTKQSTDLMHSLPKFQ